MRCLSDRSLSAAVTAVGLKSLLRVHRHDHHQQNTGEGEGGLDVVLSTVAKWVRALSNVQGQGQGQGRGLGDGLHSSIDADLLSSLHAVGSRALDSSSHAMDSVDDSVLPSHGQDSDGQRVPGQDGQGEVGQGQGEQGQRQGGQGGHSGQGESSPFRGYLPQLEAALRKNYPFPLRPALFPLPPSYTQLHSQLTAVGGYSFPALCLLCGSVMDANGRGKCAAHSINCNKDASILFLLQVRYSTVHCIHYIEVYHITLSTMTYILMMKYSFILRSQFCVRTALCFSLLALAVPISPHHMWMITVRSISTAVASRYTLMTGV